MATSRSLLVLFVFFFVFISEAHGDQIYASPTGSSGNSGTQNSPYDLETGISSLSAGDTLTLLAGTYSVSSKISISTPGTSSLPITIQGNGNAILKYTGSATEDIMELTRYENPPYDMYWVIDGIKFFNSTRAGLRLSWVQYVTVKNVESGYNGRWGIFTDFSNYLTFSNVDCHHSFAEHGIYISNTCGNELIENSRFHDNRGAGVHHNGDGSQGSGIPGYTTGEIVNSTIRNNYIYNNGAGGGAAINLDGVSKSYIYNNVIYNNVAGGIVNFATDGYNPGSNTIIHNTIYFSDPAGRYGIAIHDGSGDNVIGNNILITAAAGQFAIDVGGSGSGNTIDYNAVYVPGGDNLTFTIDGDNGVTPEEWAAQGYGAHTILLDDPTSLFTNAANYDFSEIPDGPTVQTGDIAFSRINGNVVPDILGIPRESGKVDIGAYQIDTGGGSSPASRVMGSYLLAYYLNEVQ